MDLIDIVDDVIDGAAGKPLIFVDRTKSTVVPGAVARDPDEQTVRFTRWPDRALLETSVRFFVVTTHKAGFYQIKPTIIRLVLMLFNSYDNIY
jgi:hypothetical protein